MRDAEKTQRRLIDVATQIIAEHGSAGLRVDQVAVNAKVNKRMIYHYFGDKDGLSAKVLEQQLVHLAPLLTAEKNTLLQHCFDVGELPRLPDVAERNSIDVIQLAAVITLRGLLDRLGSLGTTFGSSLHPLMTQLCSLALDGSSAEDSNALFPQLQFPAQPATQQTLPRSKERISLRPRLNPVKPP